MTQITIDVIILSYAYNSITDNLTRQTIKSLLESEPGGTIKFNIIVIESNKSLKPLQYDHTTTLYPKIDFNFNKFLNIGIKATTNQFICLSNNDVLFHLNWASNLLNEMQNDNMLCASTYWQQYHLNERNIQAQTGNIEGYRDIFSGWCFVVRRSIFEKINLFDEKINFWYSDDDFCNTLKKFSIKNYLITNSAVTHVGGYSLNNISEKDRLRFTVLPMLYFDYKWQHRSKILYYAKYLWNSLKISKIK
ncbi:MAG TPA: glycosyltransferase [Mucilaginibacter sp.]|jgi:GT2 family glycosyltransferase|nr:glycosyltransferase [Mucilaginibacter sp.]